MPNQPWFERDTTTVTDSEAAETNAETAETNAETAETNAETAETNAETAETNAETAETNAETAETNAETAETNAELAETNAELAETHVVAAAANIAALQLYGRNHILFSDEIVANGTTPSSQATGSGAYAVRIDHGNLQYMVNSKFGLTVAANDVAVDTEGAAILWPGYAATVAGGGFKITIANGANALAATDILLEAGDFAPATYKDAVQLAAIFATKINTAIGAGTVTVSFASGVFVIDAGVGTTAITIAAPTGPAVDMTTTLFGGVVDQDAVATTWTGATPNPYNGESKEYVIAVKEAAGVFSLIVAEAAPYLATDVAVHVTTGAIDTAAGSANWAALCRVTVRRTANTVLGVTVSMAPLCYGFDFTT